VKMLLLGTGDSGKSTFLRQIQHLYIPHSIDKEKLKFSLIIRKNCIDSISDFLKFLKKEEIEVPKLIRDTVNDIIEAEELTGYIAGLITSVWENKKMKKLFLKYDSQLQIPSGSPYFWEDAVRIANDQYLPTKEDIIRAKIRTVGINDVNFKYRDIGFTFIDVGGQRSERRKWLHCFDHCFAVIYLCAINEYDGRVLEEDNRVDRLEESLNLFEKLIHSMSFHNVPFILFLNKKDLFEEKIKTAPIESFPEKYPDYNDFKKKAGKDKNDVELGIDYFSQKFKDRSQGKSLYIYETTAIDEKQCKNVFHALTDYVFSNVIDRQNDF